MAECLRVVGGKGFGSTVRKEGTKKACTLREHFRHPQQQKVKRILQIGRVAMAAREAFRVQKQRQA